MSRFYLHLRRGNELFADEHGDELPDAESAYLQAFAAAQEVWAVAMEQGDNPTQYSFDVADACGQVLFTLPLTEVLDAFTRQRNTFNPLGSL